ncbi:MULTISPECIES: DUF1851 domain-containing protein [unclassified Sphingomonas]|uniref:DUF1851 domain-containing protein n=4 Tax=Pseudomonadota TaxID=1224 RepID=UPI000AE350C9|nr:MULTISPECIES: DUF1851 domain-containing protein [unclassified Sphingomonas]
MFDDFTEAFSQDFDRPSVPLPVRPGDAALAELFERFGGVSFNGGIYRVFDPIQLPKYNAMVEEGFPDFAGAVTVFGSDWLGRIFATTSKSDIQGRDGVMMFEPGTASALEIPCNVLTFHDEELVDAPDAALADEFFENWRGSGKPAPRVNQCVGYIRPLFLGGQDTTANLELIDMEVYWSVSVDLIRQARGLPAGARISGVRIPD